MMKRKGLGRGLGKGYKNIVPRDPFIHGLSAKGVKSWEKGKYWGEWRKKDNPKKIVEITDMGAHRYVIQNEKGFNAEGLISIKGSKVKAIKSAKEYMSMNAKGKSLYAKMSATELEKNLSMFIGTEQYHKLSFMPLLATDGVAYLMKEAESYWLFDAIASYQPKLKKEPFQVWILEKDKTGSGAVLKGYRDYSEEKPKKYKPLVTQKIPYTDFPLKKVKIWVENGVALLPSEH